MLVLNLSVFAAVMLTKKPPTAASVVLAIGKSKQSMLLDGKKKTSILSFITLKKASVHAASFLTSLMIRSDRNIRNRNVL